MASIARVCLIVGVVEPRALASMGLPALGAALGFGLCGAVMMQKQAHEREVDMPGRGPFDLRALLMFALAFAVAATANAALAAHVGARGLLTTSAVADLLDVNIATLSALRLVGTVATPATAGYAALAALAVNGLGRLTLAIASSPARFWAPLLLATAIAIALGAVAFFLLPLQ